MPGPRIIRGIDIQPGDVVSTATTRGKVKVAQAKLYHTGRTVDFEREGGGWYNVGRDSKVKLYSREAEPVEMNTEGIR